MQKEKHMQRPSGGRIWFVKGTPRALNIPREPEKVVSRASCSVSFFVLRKSSLKLVWSMN